ncbi:MAG: trypsin-like peptidase domain-containing protein [Lachnospiraceae bacterium]|nr:trypsin-like peptidase domain-containing protein [Lachnospiraceae bacterium]
MDDEMKNISSAMSDDEIRAAAENIGSTPFVNFENEDKGNEENKENTGYTGYTDYDYSGSTDLNERPCKTKKCVFKKIAKFIGLAACFGAVAGASFYGVSYGLGKAFGEVSFLSTSDANIEQTTTNALTQLGVSNLVIASTNTTDAAETMGNNVVVDVVKENMASTVCVGISYTITQRDMWTGRTSTYVQEGGGSGFIVGMSDTEIFVATNNHVVENAEKITITFSDDEVVNASVRATDPDNDLAIISVLKSEVSDETLLGLKVATLGSSDDAQVGEMVIAIGNALGYGQSVTVGYLSAKDRTVTYENNEMKLLQTDAAINQGNSGGPLFNVRGEVIGINCSKYSDESVEGMCFAIPISAAVPILEDLISREIVAEEDQGYLGVSIADVTETLAQLYGLPQGVRVQNVVEGGSADKAGVYNGDIITAINGVSVTTSEQLKNKVNSFKYGTTVQITIKRLVEGTWTDMTLDVQLMKKPSSN